MTSQQWRVAVLVSEGKTDKEIGSELGIAEGTVGFHVARIATALGVRKTGNTRVLITRAVLLKETSSVLAA